MSVVIKGMKLPKNCLLCPCCVGEGIGAGRQHYCQAIEDEPCVSETYRPKNCPLVAISTPHGRLIDADELIRCLPKWLADTDVMRVFERIIKRHPTITEAEVSEE